MLRVILDFQGSLQWGHDFSAVEMEMPQELKLRSLFRFNGATTFQPWKFCSRYIFGISSTDRLQWGHDFSAVEISWLHTYRMPENLLQWGHDFSAVEMTDRFVEDDLDAIASMGPRLFSRGNLVANLGQSNPIPNASMGPRLFSRGNGGLFSPSIGIEKWAVFERFGNILLASLMRQRLHGSIRNTKTLRAPPGPPGTT